MELSQQGETTPACKGAAACPGLSCCRENPDSCFSRGCWKRGVQCCWMLHGFPVIPSQLCPPWEDLLDTLGAPGWLHGKIWIPPQHLHGEIPTSEPRETPQEGAGARHEGFSVWKKFQPRGILIIPHYPHYPH